MPYRSESNLLNVGPFQSTATLYGGLAICAALLCVELLIQLIFERYTEKRKGRLTTFRLR